MFSFLGLLVMLLLAPRSIYSADTVVYSADSTEWQFPAGLPTRVPRGHLHDVCNSVNELDARAVILISGPEDVVSLTLNGFRKISLFGIIFPLEGVTGPCPNPTISNLERYAAIPYWRPTAWATRASATRSQPISPP